MPSTYHVTSLNGTSTASSEAEALIRSAQLLLNGADWVQVEVIHDGPSLWDPSGRHAGRPRLLQEFVPSQQSVAPDSYWSTNAFPPGFWRLLRSEQQAALAGLSTKEN
jgi:hypothetical protein